MIAASRIASAGMLLGCLLSVCPVTGAAGPSAQSARSWLKRVPALPSSAQLAYAQWTDDHGSLTPGADFKSVEAGIQQTVMTSTLPGAGGPATSAEALRQQYGSPEGQAKLKSMSPAELMALSRSMQPQAAPTGPISPQDQERVGRISLYPNTAAVQQGIQDVRTAGATLDQQWQANIDTIDREAVRQRAALPLCRNEAGEPSELAVRDLERKVGDQKVALADRYLPKYQALIQRMQGVVGPRIDYGDAAVESLAQLESAGMKAQLAPIARAAQNAGLSDVGLIQALTQQISKKAAQAVADRKNVDVIYAQAKGC